MPIPAFTPDGRLPHEDSSLLQAGRSPYVVTLAEVVTRFGTTQHRLKLLQGLLDYRKALVAAGIRDAFQWIDGSFLEAKELTLGLRPKDIDVVTFYELPGAATQGAFMAAHPDIFDKATLKATYYVDPYYVPYPMPERRLAERAAYWSGQWGHRRDDTRKGFIEIDLDAFGDPLAEQELARLNQVVTTP